MSMLENCTYILRAAGKAYPRTCQECGLGPCKVPVFQNPPQESPADELAALQAKEKVLFDLHEALGIKWGDDPYAAIAALQADAMRLDWWARHPEAQHEILQDMPGDGDVMLYPGEPDPADATYQGKTLRDCIDSVMGAKP